VFLGFGALGGPNQATVLKRAAGYVVRILVGGLLPPWCQQDFGGRLCGSATQITQWSVSA
jgi:hypothetical protein